MKILIIEDDAVAAIMQKLWVKRTTGQEATLFPNGQRALTFLDKQFEEGLEEKYVIFLDINMPVMNGWEFLQTCQDRPYSENISVVIVTSSPHSDDMKRAREFRLVIDYQNKPIDADTIPDFLKIEPEEIRKSKKRK